MTPSFRPRRRRRLRRHGDGGQASVFLIMLVPAVMIVLALVWEGGQMLLAKSELLGVAHSAARVGSHTIDPVATLGEGTPVVDPIRARQAATDYLRGAGAEGEAAVDGRRVVVLARTAYTPSLLPIGVRQIEAEASATALQPSG
ncbi:putative Flp pilus-assembly TadE/G-like protein [Nocardiopsis sp. Huas11]|uniref:pilus assembly protein TadG-related protein n=1 Tax=Nocardiopsis sp. Huas11 TaxID=2183912 RepID=UPI000EB08341|nr:pilus assembly protein TadG-related protein [Nocardiopsis sp. Huas11]RKS04969.1 putative Flp pilus-assembly TadE/G-like protein [Nocardiopsis sp. Huas11]